MNDNIPTTMLDDLFATDPKLEQEVLNAVAVGPAPSNDEFMALDLRQLGADDFSVVIAGMMKRLKLDDMTFTQEELSGLDAPEGQVSVLACTYSPSTGAVRFRILTGPKSEFRS
jgi:hypothetical protein